MQNFNQRLIQWAETQPALRAILAVGSQVRHDHPADQWSDFDYQLFVTDCAPYLDGGEWLAALGTVWACLPFQWPGGEPERLVLFEGGQKVDFHFFPVSALDEMVRAQTLDEVYRRGYTILVDKDGQAGRLPACPFAAPEYPKPTRDEFQVTATRFWYSALQIAKEIGRRELWRAKLADCGMLKGDLLRMMEWHARLQGRDTWYGGRFVLEWADAAVREAIPDLFAGFDVQGCWQAHRASIRLFRRLAAAVAARLDYDYPADLDDHVSSMIERMYMDDPCCG